MPSQASTPLGTFLAGAGGFFHQALYPKQDAYGHSVYTADRLPAGTGVVSCPFSLAVTPVLARASIPVSFFPDPEAAGVDDDHALLTLYLVLHLLPETLAPSASVPGLALGHGPYVASLPTAPSPRTPLYFTEGERALLRGTNLDGATGERESQWRQEWESVGARLASSVQGAAANRAILDEISWERWLWASTMISSRAFPSSLIDGDKVHSTPVLFPGVDLLNHRPRTRVTWFTNRHVEMRNAKTEEGSLTIVVDEDVPADTQVFNNYGAKTNEELLLGYGFVLRPSNDADFLALKLSLPPPSSTSVDLAHVLQKAGLGQLRHTVPRSGQIPPALLAQMRLLVAAQDRNFAPDLPDLVSRLESGSHPAPAGGGNAELVPLALEWIGWENELDVLDALGGMLENKAAALLAVDVDADSAGDPSIRPEVQDMIRVYRQGQVEIVQAALAYHEQLFEATVSKAQEAGVDLAFGDDDEQGDSDEE